MVSTANGNVKPVLSHQIRGDARVGHQKKPCSVDGLSRQAETMEQKVRKPVLSLLSSTLPPPREEA